LSRKISSVNDDLEQENRRARVLSLNSRGLARSEIAQHVNVTQQKVSADLKHIREAAKKASFVYANYFAGMNQIKKEL
jgi:transcriptional regulator